MSSPVSTPVSTPGAAPSLIEFLGTSAGLVDQFLEEQQSLTAVERFSEYQDESKGPSQERYYRNLLPLREPLPGEHFAFEVDLDRCSGCKACVTACHSLNGLDENETWRQVGLLHAPAQHRMQQNVTTACHHCAEPACAQGCPTLAYEKDPVTGIVRHLDDQCFGCQYCILKCPYDVPQYHAKKGIVRKCDMCIGRLRAGEAPACVQACPTQAIRIVLQETETVRKDPEKNFKLPGAPSPKLTLPTTRYVSKRELPHLQPVNGFQIHPEPAHTPLVFMLVLSQMAAGFWIFHLARTTEMFSTNLLNSNIRFPWTDCVGFCLVIFALNLSLLHLGRPWLAWRAVLGWRRSWLSREVIAFSALAAAVQIATLLSLLEWTHSQWELNKHAWMAHLIFKAPPLQRIIPSLVKAFLSLKMQWLYGPVLRELSLCAAAAVSLLAVFASSRVYGDTPRLLWATRVTLWKFLLSAVMGGAAAYLLVAGWCAWIAWTLPPAMMIKLGLEARVLRHLNDDDPNALWKAAQLMTNSLGKIWRLRVTAGCLGGIALPSLLIAGAIPTSGPHFFAVCAVLLALVTLGELSERYLFFTTAVAPRMPGGR